MVDVFTAVPSIVTLPITVIDIEKYQDWLNSPDLTVDSTPPTITKIFIGYAKGSGTPVPVQIEIDAIGTEYNKMLPTDEERDSMHPYDYYDKLSKANMLYRRNILMAVIRGMDPDTANVLAHDTGAGQEILQRLGYLRLPSEVETEAEDDKGEVQTVNEIGQ